MDSFSFPSSTFVFSNTPHDTVASTNAPSSLRSANRSASSSENIRVGRDALPNERNPDSFPFNVGGRVYEVGRSLLWKFPDTMMLRTVAELWEQERNEATTSVKPICIDRDGNRFVYVLDFLRNGCVTLPMTISKDSFLSDLSYYNIGTVKENEENVKEQYFQNLAFGLRKHDAAVKDLDKTIRHLQFLRECRNFAKSCVITFFSATTLNPTQNFNVPIIIQQDIQTNVETFDKVKELFAEYGLVIKSSVWSSYIEVGLVS
jgi:BTB/POZ domain